MQLLVEALETDLEWLRRHTRLLVKALEWDAEFGGEFLVYDGAIKKKVTFANKLEAPAYSVALYRIEIQ